MAWRKLFGRMAMLQGFRSFERQFLVQVAAKGAVECVQPIVDSQKRHAILATPLTKGDVFAGCLAARFDSRSP